MAHSNGTMKTFNLQTLSIKNWGRCRVLQVVKVLPDMKILIDNFQEQEISICQIQTLKNLFKYCLINSTFVGNSKLFKSPSNLFRNHGPILVQQLD